MRPAVSVCTSNAASSSPPHHSYRQPAQHAHMLRHGIGCPAPAPLRSTCLRTVSRRQQILVCAATRSCSLGSTARLPHSQHPGCYCGRCSQLRGRRLPQHPSRQLGSNQNVQPTQRAATGSSFGGGQSVDDDEEGDAGVTRELEGYEVERFQQMSRHLDLMWNVGKKPQPAPCDCCKGSGSRNCRYCNSTGAMMVGHERFCSLEQGCKPCPICNGTGEVKCSHCQGTGYRAGWLERGCPVEQ